MWYIDGKNSKAHTADKRQCLSTYYNLLQLVLCACVAAVKCRPVLHHCVVIFFWSAGIIECLFVCIWKWSFAHGLKGVSGVASFITSDEQLQ